MKKMKTTVTFHVVYETVSLIQLERLISKFDLGICGLSYPQDIQVSWNTTTKVDSAYIAKMKIATQKAIEFHGGRVISIKKV